MYLRFQLPRRIGASLAAGAALLGPFAAPQMAAAAALASPGIVSHIKVLSDHVEDVSSLEAWKRSFIKPGMTDMEKARAVWESVVKFRHQEVPPDELLTPDGHIHDPIKSFNVYGYGQCCCASANIESLARYAGLETRGWGITGHSVPEIKINGKWSMFDASLINYFNKPDGTIAGVEELGQNISDWYAANPGYKGNDDKLLQFMRNDGWRKGPALLAGGTGYDDNGWLPAATHGWYSSMTEFGNPQNNHIYDYADAVGYEVNIQLRSGERLIRNWSNKGLQVNAAEGGQCYTLGLDPDNTHDQLRYAARFGDLTTGRIGNGTLEYNLPLASGAFRSGMLTVDNLAARSEDHAGPALHVKDSTRPAALVFRMPSSFVYLGGQLTLTPIIGKGGAITLSLSDNNGLDWKPVAKINKDGAQTIDLKPYIYRRYDYRLKLDLQGKGTGLEALKVSHDIQYSQRPLPILAQGVNHVQFSAGPQEGTITVQGSTNSTVKGKQLLYSDFHPQMHNIATPEMSHIEGVIRVQGKGDFAYPISTPGDITRLRIGTAYRARDARDGWDVEVSYDGGKTFTKVDRLEGPYAGSSKYTVVTDIPKGTRTALVKFVGEERNTTCLFDIRVDADYKEPHGGFAPVKVTYTWEENGQPKQDVHIARTPDEAYTITCASKPKMKSIVLELAQ